MTRLGPSVFISYCHQGIDRDALDYLASVLRDRLGSTCTIHYDSALPIGKDLNEFMRLLDRVTAALIILTPAYKERVREHTGGVHTEFTHILHHYHESRSPTPSADGSTLDKPFEIFPILLQGSREASVPDEISHLKYLDFTRLRVSRKPTGEFKVLPQQQETLRKGMEDVANQLFGLSSLGGQSYQTLSESYYDRLFLDSKAGFNRPEYAAQNYLKTILVQTKALQRVKNQLAIFVVGRKGSGKSTIAQVLFHLSPDRYLVEVPVIADQFNLYLLYEFFSQHQFRADTKNVVQFVDALRYAWEGAVILALLDALVDSHAHGSRRISEDAQKVMETLLRSIKATDTHAEWGPEAYFTYAFGAVIRFVRECVDGAPPDERSFLAHVQARFNREGYLQSLLGAAAVTELRRFLRMLQQRVLVTLDGFDGQFDNFRRDALATGDEAFVRDRVNFEIAWLRGLLSFALEARASQHDRFYGLLDFCLALPYDRIMEVIRLERDRYRHANRWCSTRWSGVELSILLRKRLEVLSSFKAAKENSPQDRLNEVLTSPHFKHIPREVAFDYNGRNYRMDLFLYVLRHTLWRPRDILTYYSAILAIGEDLKRWGHPVTTEALRRCIKNMTRRVIKQEFFGEFESSIPNIHSVVDRFRRKSSVLTFDDVSGILYGINVDVATTSLLDNQIIEKLRLLLDIGFLGLRTTPALRDKLGIGHQDAFSFNEGRAWFSDAEQPEMSRWTYIIHPLFSEYLLLNTEGRELALQYSWEYLHTCEAYHAVNVDEFE